MKKIAFFEVSQKEKNYLKKKFKKDYEVLIYKEELNSDTVNLIKNTDVVSGYLGYQLTI